MFRKPNDFRRKITNTATPTPEIDPEAIKALREINKELSGCEEFDPREIADYQTKELPTVTTSGSIRAVTPHMQYTITSKSPIIFGEMQGAACKCVEKYQQIPSGFVLSMPLYEKLEWHRLTPKPFSGIYLFIMAGMDKHCAIPVYRNVELPFNVILCLLP